MKNFKKYYSGGEFVMKIRSGHVTRVTRVKLFAISTFLLLLTGLLFVQNSAEAFTSLKYIGGYGFPAEDYSEKYKINYARVVFTPERYFTKEVESRGLFITLNLRYRTGERENRQTIPISDYITNAEQVIRYSAGVNNVIAVSQDDFRDWWVHYAKRNVKILEAVSGKINKINPKLMYGATIYENDLDKLSAKEWKEIAKYINLVHFYLHQRPTVNDYDRYLDLVQTYFPKAKIILGIYHYDRIAYERRIATTKQEMGLFTKQLNVCFNKLSDDNIIGIEFYPGRLGKPIDTAMKKNHSPESSKLFYDMNSQVEKKLLNSRP